MFAPARSNLEMMIPLLVAGLLIAGFGGVEYFFSPGVASTDVQGIHDATVIGAVAGIVGGHLVTGNRPGLALHIQEVPGH